MIGRAAAIILGCSLLAAASPGSASDKPGFIYSASFPHRDIPKDLWPARLVTLKSMGFNAVQVSAAEGEDAREVIEILRLARQLGLRVWWGGSALPPELQPFAVSRGGPVLEELPGKSADWRGAAGARALLEMRESLAGGVRALNCAAVLEGRTPDERQAAVSIAGDLRPQAAVLSRNGKLVVGMGPLLGTLRPVKQAALRLVTPPPQKPPSWLRLTLLASPERRGPAFISALNYSDSQSVSGALAAVDPRNGRPMTIRGLRLPPRQALLMPLNVALAAPEVCATCARFAPDERIVYATAELVSAAYENGVLGLEFVAPAEGELELELAREPRGPLVTGAHLRNLNWDEKTRRLLVAIPAGEAPDFRSRVGLAIELPETSAFLKAPRRFIIGSSAKITASFSSAELAGRSRLLAPAGWRVKQEPGGTNEIEYTVDVPADAIAGDTAKFAIEMDGHIAHSAAAPVVPFCELRVEPEEALHPRRDVRFAIRPHLATVMLPGSRTYHMYLRNNYDEIRTFEMAVAGEGLRLSPSRQEVSVGASLEREIPLEAALIDPRPGVYRWRVSVRQGHHQLEMPLALAAIAPEQALAYEYDFDRDGFPELVLENQNVRVVFSPRNGGRAAEFFLKKQRVNVFAAPGALDAKAPFEGRIVGPGRIELRSGELVRTVSLAPGNSFFEVEETGGPGEWVVPIPSDLDAFRVRFSADAPDAQTATERQASSSLLRLRFPPGKPRRARFAAEILEDPHKQ